MTWRNGHQTASVHLSTVSNFPVPTPFSSISNLPISKLPVPALTPAGTESFAATRCARSACVLMTAAARASPGGALYAAVGYEEGDCGSGDAAADSQLLKGLTGCTARTARGCCWSLPSASPLPLLSRPCVSPLQILGAIAVAALILSAANSQTRGGLPRPDVAGAGSDSLNRCRLVSAVQRLASGQALRLAAVGGSITRHAGAARGWLEMLTQRLNALHPPRPHASSPANSSSSSTRARASLTSSRLLELRRADFHASDWAAPLDRHVSSNRAMGGTPSSFVSTCMASFFPRSELAMVDLLFVEFAVNDLSYVGAGSLATAQLRVDEEAGNGSGGDGFDPFTNIERLIRYALSQSIRGSGRDAAAEGAAVDGPAVVLVQFCQMDGGTAGELHRPAARHYGVPIINMCELLPHMYPGDAEAELAKRQGGLMIDHTHPTLAGHAIAAAAVVDRLLSHLDEPASSLSTERCLPYSSTASSPLPSPLVPSNGQLSNWRCTMGKFRPGTLNAGPPDRMSSMDFSDYNVTQVDGWEYVDESHGKWGWISTRPGATLTLALQPATGRVILSYLRSYSNIGTASVWITAEPGNWKSPQHTIAAWWDRPFSTFELTQLPAELFPSRSQEAHYTSQLLHLQLIDVGAAVSTSPAKAPANKFKMVAMFEDA